MNNMMKNMTVLLTHLEKSDDSTDAGCRPALNGCFITVSDRCREHPAAVGAAAEEPRQSRQNMTARQEFIGVRYLVKNIS